MDVLQSLIGEVDVDGSEEIDFLELLKLLRKYRNQELEMTENVFLKMASDPGELGELLISGAHWVEEAVVELGYAPTVGMMNRAEAFKPHGLVAKDAFNEFIRRFREVERAEFVKRAGFDEDQVEEYQVRPSN